MAKGPKPFAPVPVTLRLQRSLAWAVEQLGTAEGRSRSNMIRRLLAEAVQRRDPELWRFAVARHGEMRDRGGEALPGPEPQE